MYFFLGICFKKTTRDLRERKVCSTKDVDYSIGYNCKDIERTVSCRTLHSHVGVILFILSDRCSEADLLHKFWETTLLPNSVKPCADSSKLCVPMSLFSRVHKGTLFLGADNMGIYPH